MARPKRWFHVSQDINFDPEFERLCKEYSLPGVRFFLQVLSILDKTDNHWCLHRDFDLRVLARSCGTKPKIILSSYQLLIDMKWISVGVDPDMNQFIYARNFMKYRGNRVHEHEMTKQVSCSPPSLPFPSHIKKEEKKAILDKPKRPPRQSFEEWWEAEVKSSPAYAGINLERELEKMKVWLTKPENRGRKLTTKFALNWLNKIEPPVVINGHGSAKTSAICTRRVLVDGKTKPCTQPATVHVNQFGMCSACHVLYQQERAAREGVSHAG